MSWHLILKRTRAVDSFCSSFP